MITYFETILSVQLISKKSAYAWEFTIPDFYRFERFLRSLPERPEKIRLCSSLLFFTGASQFLVGLGSVISCVSEAVMFFGIFYIFRHFSHATFMAIGLVGYIFRFCVFASVTNPWLVLPVEIFQGGYIYLLWQCLVQ